ncbi:MAG TPA: extracellular solute-binding protein [bacterium]|nr:extracellular solute-binding protein [bacterium]
MLRSAVVRAAVLLALALPASLLAGGGIAANSAPSGFPTDKITLTMFGSDEAPGFHIEEGLIAEWQKTHPNVTVEAAQTPLGPGFQKLSTQLPTGGGPTLFAVFEPWIEGFIPYMAPAIPAAFGKESMRQIYDLYLPHALEAQSRGGAIYCLPISAPSWSLLVNKPLFTGAGLRIPEDIPRTWAQVAALQKKLTKYDASGKLVRRGFGVRYTAGPQWYSMLFVASVESQGARVLDRDGSPLLTSQAAVNAMQIFKDTAVAPTITKDVQTSPYQDFADGLDVMSYGGANAVSFAIRLNPDLKGNVYVSQLPSLSGQPGGSPKYSFDFCVNKRASATEQFAAWSLIDYMTSRGVVRFVNTGSLTPRKVVFEAPDVQSTPFIEVFKTELTYARPLPQTKYWGQLQGAIQNGVQKVVFKDVPIPQALQEAQHEYLQAIGK